MIGMRRPRGNPRGDPGSLHSGGKTRSVVPARTRRARGSFGPAALPTKIRSTSPACRSGIRKLGGASLDVVMSRLASETSVDIRSLDEARCAVWGGRSKAHRRGTGRSDHAQRRHRPPRPPRAPVARRRPPCRAHPTGRRPRRRWRARWAGRSCCGRYSRWIRLAVPAAGGAWPWSRGSPTQRRWTGSWPIVVGGGSSHPSRECRPGHPPRRDVAPRGVTSTRPRRQETVHPWSAVGGAVRPAQVPKPVEARAPRLGWPSSVPRGVPGDPTPCAGGGSVSSAGTRTATGPIQMPVHQEIVWAARGRG